MRAITLSLCVSSIALIVLLSSVPVVLGGSDVSSPGRGGVLDRLKALDDMRRDRIENMDSARMTNADFEAFSYEDGSYPGIQPNGASADIEPLQVWGDHYVSDIMYSPPNNPGGGYSLDATGGAGNFTVGGTHEFYIGDQNGNGILEWVVYYSYLPWGVDGIDNDGDGCVDEKTYGDWDGQVGCDLIPDQFVYYGTGGLPDVGGVGGKLAVNVDWYSPFSSIEIYRIFTMAPWTSLNFTDFAYRPRVVNNADFITYHSREDMTGINANPEMDADLVDQYVASIDARNFPSEDPINNVCFAGTQLDWGQGYLRNDGNVIVAFQLHEDFDSQDWNGDTDETDTVAAYYVIDNVTGKCDQGVNLGVYSLFPTVSGNVLTSNMGSEAHDGRDWNGDGIIGAYVLLWHNVSTSWNLVGPRYTSSSFTSPPGAFGNGFWGIYRDLGSSGTHVYALNYGAAWSEYVAVSMQYYQTFFFLTADEDGNPQTDMPHYNIGNGQPGNTLGGWCVHIWAREYYLEYAGVNLIGGIADGNGDGDYMDTLNYIFCPDRTGGGGEYIVESTSKYAKGLYEDNIPFIWAGYVYYQSAGDVLGWFVLPTFYDEIGIDDDADGNLLIEPVYYHAYYWAFLVQERARHLDGGIEIPDGPVSSGGSGKRPIAIVEGHPRGYSPVDCLLFHYMHGTNRKLKTTVSIHAYASCPTSISVRSNQG